MATRPKCSKCNKSQAVRPGGLCNKCFGESTGAVVKSQRLPLDRIRTDGGTQARAHLDEDTVADYATAMEAGDVFPPLMVYFDGSDYWLAGGFHRYFAYRRHGASEAECIIKRGTQQDAKDYAVRDNATHGKPRTYEDKKRAIEILFEVEERKSRSIAWIRRETKIHDATLKKIMAELGIVRPEMVNCEDGSVRAASVSRPPSRASIPPTWEVGLSPADSLDDVQRQALDVELSSASEPATVRPVADRFGRVAQSERCREALEWAEEFDSALSLLKHAKRLVFTRFLQGRDGQG